MACTSHLHGKDLGNPHCCLCLVYETLGQVVVGVCPSPAQAELCRHCLGWTKHCPHSCLDMSNWACPSMCLGILHLWQAQLKLIAWACPSKKVGQPKYMDCSQICPLSDQPAGVGVWQTQVMPKCSLSAAHAEC